MGPGRIPAALRALLAREQVELLSAEPAPAAGCWQVRGRRWVAVTLSGRAAPLHVALPVAGEVRRGAHGRYEAALPAPTAEEIDEARAFAASLAAHGQIAAPGARGTASHEIVVDTQGREKLVRRGFNPR